MTETTQQKIARLQAEIDNLKAQHPQPPVAPRASNIVHEPQVTITFGEPVRAGTLPTETEVDQLLDIVERAGHLPKSALDTPDFRRSFITALQFLANVGRTENVNTKITAHEWALHAERFMSELGRTVTLTNGGFWAACLASGVTYALGHQDRGIPARVGLNWDSGLERANSRWRQILRQGKTLPPISPPAESLRPAPVTIRLDRSVSGM